MAILDKLKFWKKEEEEFKPEEGFGALEEKETMPGGELGRLPGEELGGLGPDLPPMEGEEKPPTGIPPELTGIEHKPPSHVPPTYAEIPPQQLNQTEVISAKLDAIKASIDSINVRLERIERATAHHDKEHETWYKH